MYFDIVGKCGLLSHIQSAFGKGIFEVLWPVALVLGFRVETALALGVMAPW